MRFEMVKIEGIKKKRLRVLLTILLIIVTWEFGVFLFLLANRGINSGYFPGYGFFVIIFLFSGVL